MKTKSVPRKRTHPFRKVRNDMFEEELSADEDSRMSPGAEDRLRRPKSWYPFGNSHDMNPAFQSFENQDEMDADTQAEIRKMVEEEFGPGARGKIPSMITDEKSPWGKIQIDPHRDRAPTPAELDEMERALDEFGISEKELQEIEDSEYARKEEDEDAILEEQEATEYLGDDEIPVPKQNPAVPSLLNPSPNRPAAPVKKKPQPEEDQDYFNIEDQLNIL